MAARQERVITSAQLHECGVTDSAIMKRARAGRLFRVHRGVYGVGPGELSTKGRFFAAVLAIGDDAALCDVSAAHLWGFWPYLKDSEPVHVTVPRKVRPRRGIVVHRADNVDTTRREGIRVVTPAQALFGMATTLRSDRALRRAVHEAEVQKRLSQSQLQAVIARNPRTRAARRLTAVTAHGPTPTRSYDEDDVVEMLRANGLPRHKTNVRIPGLPRWIEVDIWFPDHGLVIEVDSPFHDTQIRQEDDARKQAIIEAHGLRLLRVRRESVSLAEIRALLQLG